MKKCGCGDRPYREWKGMWVCYPCLQSIRHGAKPEQAFQASRLIRSQAEEATVVPDSGVRDRIPATSDAEYEAMLKKGRRERDQREAANKRARQLLADDNGVAELAESIEAKAKDAGEELPLLEGLWGPVGVGEHYDRWR